MDLGFQDAAAVVVGGGRGMGFATARCLATDGARVADVSDAERVETLFAEVGQRWNGELNVLVNAVGPSVVGSFEDLTDEQWLQAVDDGVMGMVRCVRAALPLLRKAPWARIVNFS